MTDTKQPEALRLAAWLQLNSSGIYRPAAEAAEVLREQHARIAELEAENRTLKEQHEAIGAGGVTGLRNSDAALIDFLANKDQSIANVMLPAHIIERNLHSMRDAIKDAKAEWEAIAQEGGK